MSEHPPPGNSAEGDDPDVELGVLVSASDAAERAAETEEGLLVEALRWLLDQ